MNENKVLYFEKKPIMFKIIEIIKESISEKYTLKFDSKFKFVYPGNFIMLWIPGIDEIPLSCSYNNGITFQVIGESTYLLSKLKKFDYVWIRGPFGTSFTIPKNFTKVLLIGGGLGAAPLGYLSDIISKNKSIQKTVFLGIKTKNDLIFEKRFKKNSSVFITTDDGSYINKGVITKLFGLIEIDEFSKIYVCGPELMMYNIYSILKEKNCLIISEFLLERYFKCGIGICGSCCIDNSGFRVCKDGPVFSGILLNNIEFGKYHRTESGKKIKY